MQNVIEYLQFFLLQYIWPVLAVVITFGIAVLLHEFGHFVVARLSGVPVEVFSVGFGRRLWGVVRGGTDYRICAIPVGGYVKIKGILSEETERYLEGEDADEKDEKPEEGDTQDDGAEEGKSEETSAEAAGDEDLKEKRVTLMADAMDSATGLRDKPWIIRVLVFSAGCAFNFLVAVVAFFFIIWIGTDRGRPFQSKVANVKEGSPLYEAGLRYGDWIVEIDGQSATTWADIATTRPGVLTLLDQRLKRSPKEPVLCVVQRGEGSDATTHSLRLPSAEEITRAFKADEVEDMKAPCYIGDVVPFSAAHKAGLKRGDVVVAVDGKPIESFNAMRDIVLASPGKALSFLIRRGDERVALVITPKKMIPRSRKDEPPKPAIGQIGIIPGNVEREYYREPFFKALPAAFVEAGELTRRVAVGTFEIFARFTYREAKDNLAGPIGIFGLTFSRARQGWRDFLFTMALLNVALMILNILPIPVLDGGHILITTVEGITRRPVPPRVLASIFYVFFFLIIGLVLMVTWIDISRFADWFGLTKLFR